MRNRKWMILLVSVILVLIFILPSCSTQESTTKPAATTAAQTTVATTTKAPATTTAATTTVAAPKSGGTLKVGVGNEAVCLGQPGVGSRSVDSFLSAPAIEQLQRMLPNGDFSLWLIDTAVPDLKALTVTMTLKKGIRFHDGADFNAEALKWNLEWQKANKSTNVAKMKSVDVIDDYTVRVNLTEWGSDIVYDLTGIYIVSPASWKKNGDDWGKQNPVGTGPFKLASRQTDVSIKYVKNPDYWQSGKPYLDGIEFIIIKDATTRLASFKAGTIDLSIDPSIAQVKEIKSDPKYLVHRGIGFGGSYRLNPDAANADSPFSKLEVRQAVASAIDKQALVDGIMAGYAMVSTQGFPSNTWVYNPNFKGYPYDPAKAKQLLTSAGYVNGFECSLIGANGGIDPLVLTAIQDMLAQVNIKATLNLQSSTAINAVWSGGWKNGLGFSNLPPNPNMISWTANFSWKSTRQTSKSVLSSPEIDAACDKATTGPSDMATRQPVVWNLMDVIFNKNVQSIPLFITDSLLVQYPYVKSTGMYEACLSGSWNPESAWLNR